MAAGRSGTAPGLPFLPATCCLTIHLFIAAQTVPNRTDSQCRERWINRLNPGRKKSRVWTPEEKAKLLSAVQANTTTSGKIK